MKTPVINIWFIFTILISMSDNKKTETLRTPEFSREFVILSHKISSTTSKPQLIKVGEKYFRVKELG